MISLDWGMFWQVLNFFILMFILVKYLYQPITEVLDKRSNKIESDLSQAEQKRQEAQELKEKYEEELANARQEAQEIRSKARQKAEQEKSEILQEANEEANRKINKAEEEIARSKREAMSEMRDEVATMSVLIAEKLLEKSIDQQAQEQIVSEYIDQLDSEKIGEMQC
ncbi:MAG: F0F1 ATP synthase subunit B [Bacillota bacterium]